MEDVFDVLQGPAATEDIEEALQRAEALCGAQLPTGGDDRPATAFTLGETALALRLTVHEKELELMEVRQQYMQLAVSLWQSSACTVKGMAQGHGCAQHGRNCCTPYTTCSVLMCAAGPQRKDAAVTGRKAAGAGQPHLPA
jgi:hypothetical protein